MPILTPPAASIIATPSAPATVAARTITPMTQLLTITPTTSVIPIAAIPATAQLSLLPQIQITVLGGILIFFPNRTVWSTPIDRVEIATLSRPLDVLNEHALDFVKTVHNCNRSVIGGISAMNFQPLLVQGPPTWAFSMTSRDGREWMQIFQTGPSGGDALRTKQTFNVSAFWEVGEVLPLIDLTNALLKLIRVDDLLAFDVIFNERLT